MTLWGGGRADSVFIEQVKEGTQPLVIVNYGLKFDIVDGVRTVHPKYDAYYLYCVLVWYNSILSRWFIVEVVSVFIAKEGQPTFSICELWFKVWHFQ